MNGSDVWGSSAPYGDVLPVFKWNIYKKNKLLHEVKNNRCTSK